LSFQQSPPFAGSSDKGDRAIGRNWEERSRGATHRRGADKNRPVALPDTVERNRMEYWRNISYNRGKSMSAVYRMAGAVGKGEVCNILCSRTKASGVRDKRF